MTKKGRPKIYKPKNNILKVRVSDEYLSKLKYIKDKHGYTTSEIIRNAIDIYYKMLLYK